MLSSLITSKIKAQIVMRLFLNPERHVYLRELADEFNASTSHIKTELDLLKIADLLTSEKKGRQNFFSANTSHPVFPELQSMVKKSLGMDRILDSILTRLGNLKQAYLIDDYAQGKDTGIIDIVLVGNIDQYHLNDLTRKTERYIKRRIRTLVLDDAEFKSLESSLQQRGMMLLWESAEK
jgi:hypothetical protein